MKTTLMFRPIANPRRTTLAHLTEATEATEPISATEAAETPAETGREADADSGTGARPLPQRTANPRRTVLTELPKAPVAP